MHAVDNAVREINAKENRHLLSLSSKSMINYEKYISLSLSNEIKYDLLREYRKTFFFYLNILFDQCERHLR